MNPDQALMRTIKSEWGTLISYCCSTSSVPPAFLAALIAGESGGDPHATRYEPAVFRRMEARHPDWDTNRLTANATSWGLTQIMGENYPGPPAELADPETNLIQALKMLARFAEAFQLDLTKEFSELATCWNTGAPNRVTYDPNYCSNLLARMQIYPMV